MAIETVKAAAATAEVAKKSFDWTSKVMVAVYAALATTALIISAYFVVGYVKKRRVHQNAGSLPQQNVPQVPPAINPQQN